MKPALITYLAMSIMCIGVIIEMTNAKFLPAGCGTLVKVARKNLRQLTEEEVVSLETLNLRKN